MTTLHEHLAALADQAPYGDPPAPDLWDRGRRIARRRRWGTAAIALAMVLGVASLAGADWWRARPEIAPATGTAALPDRIWAPSPWLDGTDDAGELGVLAAIQQATRNGWTGSDEGFVGISASTGEYRFLDLPDQAIPAGTAAALAPDGRHVAYWYSGATRESPHDSQGPAATGIAVYDTTTGDVVRHAIPTDHGLAPSALAWLDADRVLLSYGQWVGGRDDSDMAQSRSKDDTGLLVWDFTERAAPGPLAGIGGRLVDLESAPGDGTLLVGTGRRFIWLDVDTGQRQVFRLRPGRSILYVAAVDGGGSRVAWPGGNHNPNKIRIGAVSGGIVEGTIVPDSGRTFSVLRWLDHDHVAAVRRVGGGYSASALMSVDVTSGASEELLRYPAGTYGSVTQLAADLVGQPTVPGIEPQHPMDPRAVAGGLAVVVGCGIGGIVLWRRRVGP